MRFRFPLILGIAFLLPGLAFAGPKFSASSQKSSSSGDNSPSMAFDGLLSTSWAEDKPGNGLGEWIEVDLGKDVAIETLSIWGGDFSSRQNWKGRARVAEATVSWTGPDGADDKTVELGDRFSRRDLTIGATVRTIKIQIDEIHEGGIFADAHIAEIAFDFRKKPDASLAEAVEKKITSSRSLRKQRDAAEGELGKLLEACQNNVDYSANFRAIGDMAARGASYRVPVVQSVIPVGSRLQMLPFNEDAVVALGQLKDANAIPYLDIAAAGARDNGDREWLLQGVARFEAQAELRRGMRSTVPNWGSTGMEKGAFKSRGEPLSIAADSQGNIWVADTGNNRVQRLTSMGTADLVIGGDKAIVTSWFGDESEPYASASKAGREVGQFMQPMFVCVGNYDNVMVIDADLRVQTFDPDGKPIAQWQLETRWRPRSGAGNATPIITWLDDDFYIIVRDEVWTYTAEGEKKNQYNLEGGKVQAGVIAAKGKLLVRHVGSREITEYKPEDGFKQGRWMKKDVPDDGSEDWDLATDEKDGLYVVTDAGKVYYFNKRGKFLGEIPVFENPKDMPRIAVFDTLIFVSAKDKITRYEREE
jgi:hypothetical protein